MVSDTSSAPPDLDLVGQTVDEFLSDATARFLLEYLVDATGPVPIKDLALHLAAYTHETTSAHISTDRQRRALAQLRHRYLPRFRDAQVLIYDEQQKRVSATATGRLLVDTMKENNLDANSG